MNKIRTIKITLKIEGILLFFKAVRFRSNTVSTPSINLVNGPVQKQSGSKCKSQRNKFFLESILSFPLM